MLAKTSYEDFFEYYEWLGYYSRARNMLKTAQIITKKYNWVFPNEYDELIKFPWVWPYTAKAIQAFAYEKPVMAFDTNLEKVFSRYYFWDKYQKLSKQQKEDLEKQCKETNINPRKINNALMDFSNIESLKKESVDWQTYPLKNCEWFKTKWEKEFIPQKWIKKQLLGANIILHLHENHKIYFSENEDIYTPFYISWWKDSPRETVKAYFLEKFWLSVSVRPPHKNYETNEKIIVECNAQIQKGKHDFFCFNKDNLN